MTTSVTIKAYFNAAHRLVHGNMLCVALHGHSYVAEFTFTADKLSEGIIVEFEDAEKRLQSWFNDNWDHNLILSDSDKELGEAISKITKQKVFYYQGLPTLENLTAYLLHNVAPKLFADTNGKCTRVKLIEFSKSEYSCTVEL
jgi:6-pyruvoyltetrahydropterin/6-carboxytetrahydropterin synthase